MQIYKGEMKMKTLTLLAIFVVGTVAHAKTNVEQSINQLKENVVNSEANLAQYKTNMEISAKNATVADKAAKEMAQFREQLKDNVKNVEKNKVALDLLEQDIIKYKAAEQEKLTKDEAQVAQVKAFLKKLEDNKAQRELNITAYDQKLQEVKQERLDWSHQIGRMDELNKEINEKEAKAKAEKAKWLAKEKDYKKETNKWDKQVRNSKSTYQKYSRLKD